MSKKNHYVLFSCDQWKGRASMRLIGVFTLPMLRKIVKRKVRKGDFEFGGNSVMDIDEIDANQIDRMLTYGYIEEVTINQEQ